MLGPVSTRKIMLNDKFLLSDFFQIFNRKSLTHLLQVVSKVLKLADFSKIAEVLAAVSKKRKENIVIWKTETSGV